MIEGVLIFIFGIIIGWIGGASCAKKKLQSHSGRRPKRFLKKEYIMPQTKPDVTLLAHTPHPRSLIYAAFRQCYHAGNIADMWPRLLDEEIPREKQDEFVKSILESGHTSPVEHVSFTFALSGVSRALTHQLVRHRLASYSQQSQRYVDGSNFDYIVPPSIAGNSEATKRFETIMGQIGSAYAEIVDLLSRDQNTAKNKAYEDARFVLPQAASTSIVVTMNCRELLHFFEERCCQRAQWEIRNIAYAMLKICRDILPVVFDNAGAKCVRLGYCPEGKFSCGRFPVKL